METLAAKKTNHVQRDTQIFEIIKKELERQTSGIELIASENFVSPQVLEAMGSVLTNKYAEGYPGRRYYGGCEFVDESEQLAIDRIKKLFGAEYANVQPHSGAQANAAVMLALLKPGDKILGFNLSHGVHLTHGSSVNFSGKLYMPSFYGVDETTGVINMDKVEEIAKKEHPKLIICGASAYSRDWDYKRFRLIADKVGAFLMADIAHPAGLIACGLLNNPLEHCHVVTSTTHKTLRGPRGGIILIGKDYLNPLGLKNNKGEIRLMSSVIDSAVFPGTQGGPLEHVIAAKAVAFYEALTPEYKIYISQVRKNARVMADAFVERGYKVMSGGTDNHLILIDLRSKKITGKLAEETLGKAAITVNKNMVPFDDKSPMVTSGMRIGTAAVTTRGMREADMLKIADWIDRLILNAEDEKIIASTHHEVKKFASGFPLFGLA